MNATIAQSKQLDGGTIYPKRWLAMGVLFLSSFMNLVDMTIVNVALPAIQRDLSASATELEWVMAIYILALASGLLPFGRFGDVFGRKKLFLIGLVGFGLTSAACGLASNIETLIVARGIQGIASAMMTPQILAIIHVIFPPEEKSRVFGLFGMITSLGAVAGPVIGGTIISANLGELGWRPIFLINIPLGIAILIGSLRWLPAMTIDKKQRNDWIGALLLAASVTILVLPLIEGQKLGWPWWCFASIATSALIAIMFVRWQNFCAMNNKAQLLPASLLKNSRFMTDMAMVALFFSGMPGFFLVLAVFFQSGLGMTPFESGLTTAPFPVGIMIASIAAGKLGSKWHTLRIAVGSLLMAIGLVALQFIVLSIGDVVTGELLILPLLISGLGIGLAAAALFQSTLANVNGKDAGAGSGAMQTFQQIGAVIGIAIIGHFFFVTLGNTPETYDYIRAVVIASWYPIMTFSLILMFQANRFRGQENV